MRLRPILRRAALAATLALGLGAGLPAAAVEPPPGSANFTPPGFVPNYFSNESGSFRGDAGAHAMPPSDRSYAAPEGTRPPAVASRQYARHTAARRTASARRGPGGRHVAAARRHMAHANPAHARRAAAVRGGHAASTAKAATAGGRAGSGKTRHLARARG